MNWSRRTVLFGLPALLAGAGSEPPPVLVELFTSEGCSSCPPADRLLRELAAGNRIAGARIVAMSEHVDYWNNLGWKDPFSQNRFSTRQEWYSEHFAGRGVYTPQMVVDGVREMVGSDSASAMRAIGEAARKPKRPVEIAWNSAIGVRIPAGEAFAEPAALTLAITERNLAVDVSRGENGGRKLEHTAVVRDWQDLGRWDGRTPFSTSLTPRLAAGWKRTDLSAVVFAQEQHSRRIVALGAISRP